MRDELLERSLVHLLREEPFFSSFYRAFRKQPSNDISTAGVSVSDGNILFYYNREFFKSLEPRERIGLLKHEAYHIIFEHCTERKRTPHLVWNYATDLAINSLIPEHELPKGGLIPGMPVPEEISKLPDPNLQKASSKIYELIESFPKEESSEWYFEKLMELQEEFEEMKKGTEGEPGDGSGGSCPGLPGPLDNHDGWGEGLSDEQKEKIKNAVKESLGRSVREADGSSRGWGNIGGATQKRLREMVAKTVNWKEILNYFVGTTQRGEKRRTHRRINRKYPYIHPGTRRSYKSTIAIYIDQSGSVGDNEIELFFAALSELKKETEFVVFHFDTAVDEKSRTRWKKHKKYKAHRTRCGGTCFKSVTRHFDKVKDEFDGYIIMTDGYAPKPPRAVKKRCWIVCPHGEIPAWVASEDTSIKMSFNNV
jgi:predicted metal-dependent peptidase